MNKTLKNAGISEKYFDNGEIKLNYVSSPPKGIPIVFIPGQAATWEEYSLILPKLAHRFQVFAVSLRGHGKSSKTPNRYTFNILGKDMTTFLREIVGKPAIICGNSSGGVLAVWLAAYSPEWVRGVVCEDPPLFTCEWPLIKKTWVYDVFDLTANSKKGIARIAKFLLKSKKIFPNEVKKHLGQIMGKKSRALLKGFLQFDSTFSKAFTNGTAGEGFDHETALAMIKQPLLFLHANWFMIEGRLLGALSDEEVARVKSLIKGSWTYVKMNCGHAIPFEKPDDESQEIMNWVDKYLTD